MRTCTKCKIAKLESEFYWQSWEKQRLHAECKACYKEHRKTYARQHYERYGEQYRQRARKRNKRFRDAYREFMIAFLNSHPCLDCGESDPIVLELDHRDPKTKNFNISQTAKFYKSKQEMLDEIAKCDVVCANCHKKRTAVQFKWYKAVLE